MRTVRNAVWLAGVAVCCLATEAHANLITVDPDDYASGTNISTAVEGITLHTLTGYGDGSAALSDVFAAADPNCVGDDFYCSAITGQNVFFDQPQIPPSFPNSEPAAMAWYRVGGAASCLSSMVAFGWSDCTNGIRDDIAPDRFFQALVIVLDQETDYAEFSGFFRADAPYIYALDAQGNRIAGSVTLDWHHGVWNGYDYDAPYYWNRGMLSFESAFRDIKYIVAGGTDIASSVDVLRFNAYYPHAGVPAPGPLGLFCVGLAAIALRRRRKAN